MSSDDDSLHSDDGDFNPNEAVNDEEPTAQNHNIDSDEGEQQDQEEGEEVNGNNDDDEEDEEAIGIKKSRKRKV